MINPFSINSVFHDLFDYISEYKLYCIYIYLDNDDEWFDEGFFQFEYVIAADINQAKEIIEKETDVLYHAEVSSIDDLVIEEFNLDKDVVGNYFMNEYVHLPKHISKLIKVNDVVEFYKTLNILNKEIKEKQLKLEI